MKMQILELYKQQTKCLVALDSIIFGFDGEELKLLLVKRGVESDKETWSLMGGWLSPNETLQQAADRILFELTGLTEVYLEQVSTFGEPTRDPIERTVSIAYFALINVPDYETRISHAYDAQWFSMSDLPNCFLTTAKWWIWQLKDCATKRLFTPLVLNYCLKNSRFRNFKNSMKPFTALTWTSAILAVK